MINEKEITNALEQMGRKLTMTDAENARVARVLQEHITHNPLTIAPKSIPSPFAAATLWLGRVVVVGAIALVVTGSTIIVAANQALPGNTLYGFKVGVNEEIQSFLKPTPAARLVFESQRTEERLSEAHALIARGNFTPEAQQTIKENIEKHSQEISRQAQELAETNPEIYAEVKSQTQNALARKVEEIKALAEESLLDPNAKDEMLLAAIAVTEQVSNTLEQSDEQVNSEDTTPDTTDADAVDSDNEASSTLDSEPAKHNAQYLAYLIDDTRTRLRALKDEASSEEKQPQPTASMSAASTLPAAEAPEVKSDVSQEKQILENDTPTKKAQTPKTALPNPEESPLDIIALEKMISELEALHTKIVDLRSLEPLPNDRIEKNINLFLDLAQEIYQTLGLNFPDPIAILPTTNGVVIPVDERLPSSESPSSPENTTSPNE